MPPIYQYINDETGEEIELLQSVNQEHKYVLDGVEWRRVFTVPQILTDTKLDPFSARDFANKTSKSGTVGDVWDLAKEMKERRIEKEGRDEIGEKAAAKTKAKDEAIKAARRAKRVVGKNKKK